MKKAYVKPVFFAEEYELTASVASCDDGYSASVPYETWEGTFICKHNGHTIGNSSAEDPVNAYWDYATDGAASSLNDPDYSVGNMGANYGAYVFSGHETQCDFVWTSYTGFIGVWKDAEGGLISNMDDRNNEGSWVDDMFGGIKYTFMQFFRKASSGCDPAFKTNEGGAGTVLIPFS